MAVLASPAWVRVRVRVRVSVRVKVRVVGLGLGLGLGLDEGDDCAGPRPKAEGLDQGNLLSG